MSTLYLQIDHAAGPGYPVRLGVVDVDQPGAVRLEDVGILPVALPPPPAPGSMGSYLHALVADGAGPRLAELLHQADVRSVAVDVRPADLVALPWETMDPGPGQRYLFINDERPWSRGRWDDTGPPVPALGPLRLLVVVCGAKDQTLGAEEEIDGIYRAVSRSLGRIHLEVIDSPPEWAALKQEIVDLAPHVVHLIGHTLKAETQSVLEFTPAAPPTWELTSDMISQLWPEGPRLVVLSACRSSRGDPSTGAASMTDALKAAGVSAVLGMRGDITSSAAADFAAAFYGALADDKNVDAAAAAGRRAILDGAPAGPDWHYPVLETLVPASHVLPIRYGVDMPPENLTRGIPEFAKLQSFVEQRRRTWWAIDPEGLPGHRPARSGVLMTGPRGSGKTWLAQASLLVCFWRGRRLHYIDLKAQSVQGELGETSKDWLGMLRAIRDGTPGCHLSPELDPQAFATFNARLNWLVKNPPTAAMPTQVQGAADDERQRFDPEAGQVSPRIAAIFRDFLAALETAAARQHIVLVLDGVDGVMEQSWRDYVLPYLIAPLANGVPGVSLLLIVPLDLARSHLPGDDVVTTMERVEVGEFKQAQIDRVIREYAVKCLFNPWQVGKFQQFFCDFEQLQPAELGKIETILRPYGPGGR